MKNRNKNHRDDFFQNSAEYFENYAGKIIAAEDIKLNEFKDLSVAIIGANQLSVSLLEYICLKAKSVKVFQIKPHFVLPHTAKGVQRLVSHPLMIKNRRLFNNQIKSLLAIRYLESQVSDTWLKHQLMPNSASERKVFFKSDTYYSALQSNNCKLITWPVVKITEEAIQTMDGIDHLVDLIVHTYVK